MCNVTDIRHVEDCFDGGFIKEFEIDSPLDETLMRQMAEQADLQYFPDFPRPYFRIDRKEAFTIQGVLGKQTFRVTFVRKGLENWGKTLVQQIQKGAQHGC